MNSKLLFLFVFLLSFSLQAQIKSEDDLLVDRLLDIAGKTDVFFWGETHGINEQRALLTNFFLEAARRKTFDVIATEAINDFYTKEYQKSFDPKIIDPQNPKSTEAFIDELVMKGGGWVNNGGYFLHQTIREMKKIDPELKICGIDVIFAANDLSYEKSKTDQQKAWEHFPESLRQMIIAQTGKTKKELYESDSFLRDAAMAAATAKCLKGSRHALVHGGAYHFQSPRILKELDPKGHSSILSSYLKKIYLPQKNFVILRNAIETREFGEDYRIIDDMVARQNLHGNTLMTNEEFRSQFSEKEISLLGNYLNWDLMIVGPEGHDYIPGKN